VQSEAPLSHPLAQLKKGNSSLSSRSTNNGKTLNLSSVVTTCFASSLLLQQQHQHLTICNATLHQQWCIKTVQL
jgi:hypothetical protein